MFSVSRWRALAIWAVVPFVRSGRTGKTGLDKGCSRGYMFVGKGAADETKVSLVAATKGGADGLAVCFAFFFEFGETCVGRITAHLCQQGALEVVLPLVDLGARHGLF
jgi:hypothetical protein